MRPLFRPWLAQGLLAVAAAFAVAGLGACGGTGGPGPGSPSGAASSPAGLAGVGGPLQQSRLYYLTRLTAGQLCGLLHPGEAARIAGAPTAKGRFASSLGLAISCSWAIPSASGQLMIVISQVEDWQRTQATDRAGSHSVSTSVDGHPAVYFLSTLVKSAHLDVASAGPGDPAVTFDAPTLAEAVSLAQIVTPRLLAISAG